jgi:hypothetical protein
MFQVGPFRIHFHRPVSGFPAGEEPTVSPGASSAVARSVEQVPVRGPKRTGAPTYGNWSRRSAASPLPTCRS